MHNPRANQIRQSMAEELLIVAILGNREQHLYIHTDAGLTCANGQ